MLGACKFCFQNAGLLKSEHAECRSKYDAAYAALTNLVSKAYDSATDVAEVGAQVEATARSGLVPPSDRLQALVRGWETTVDSAFDDELLTVDEEHRLVALGAALGVSQTDLDVHGAFARLTKGAVLRDLQEGKVPTRMSVVGDVPFNLQKGETLVWAFPGTSLLEVRAHRSFEGGSQGVSVRIVRGVYYRVGAFKGHPVETMSTDLVDVGMLGVTNRSLYFAGAKKGLRIPYPKITSFTPYTDGLGIQRDAVSARPQAFTTVDKDGWFIFNLVNCLARIEAEIPVKPPKPRSTTDAGAAPEAAVDMKTCPDCAETVRAEARICRFCRHEFAAESKPAITRPPDSPRA